jgi:hypothetical protein
MSDPRRRLLAPAVLLLAVGLSAGCTSDGDSGRPAARTPTTSASTPSATPKPVRTRVSVVNVAGRLPRDARQRVQRHVGRVVDGWFDAAYVGGRYPRRDFSDAYPGFTSGARAQAHRDRALMSNQPLGARISGVTATRRWVFLDVLAPRRHAAAVTARVRLAYRTEGRVERDVEVRGRLFLTPGPHGWQVFGYDVAKGTPAELARQARRSHGPAHHQASHGKKSHGKKGAHGKKSHHHAKGGDR